LLTARFAGPLRSRFDLLPPTAIGGFVLAEVVIGVDRAALAAFAAVAAIVAMLRPQLVMVAAMFCSALFTFQLQLPFLPLGLTGLDVLIVALVAWALADGAFDHRRAETWSPAQLGTAAFLVVATFGLIYGAAANGVREALSDYLRLLPLFLLWPAVKLFRRDRRLIAWVFGAAIVGATMASAYAIYASVEHYPRQLEPFASENALLPIAGFGDLSRTSALIPVNFLYLTPALVCSAAFAVRRWWFTAVAIALILSISLGLITDFTRARWLAAALAVLVFMSTVRRWVIVPVVILGALGLVEVVSGISTQIPFADAFAQRINSQSLSDPLDLVTALYRLDEIGALWAAFVSNPLVGVGLGFKLVFYTPYAYAGITVTQLWHNDYLFVLAKLGLFGAAGVVAFVAGLAVSLRQFQKLTNRSDPQRVLIAGGLAGAAATLITGALHGAFTDPGTLAYLTLVLSAVVALTPREIWLKAT
jgi:hypothetical protein